MLNRFRREATDAAPHKRVASLLEAAAAPSEPGPVPGEDEALTAFRASHDSSRRSSVLSSRSTVKAAVAAALGSGVLLTGGVAAAATGALPGAAQDTASEMLGKIGVEVPGPNEASAGHADQRGQVEDSDGETTETTDTTTEDGSVAPEDAAKNEDKGGLVSKVATKGDYSGVEKGAAVSDVASDGKSQAGDQHGKAAGTEEETTEESSQEPAEPTQAENGKAPVETPNEGGTGPADQATTDKSDGASTDGTETADEKSSGSSAGGSANRP